MVGILILDPPPTQAGRVPRSCVSLSDPPHPALGSPYQTNIRENVRISASGLVLLCHI